jgi:hypothetical protein
MKCFISYVFSEVCRHKVAGNVDGLLPGWILCYVRPATEPG